MNDFIKNNRIFRLLAKIIYFNCIAPFRSFPGSKSYWERRYESGGTSGAGSYRRLAEFKAEILNDIVEKKHIRTVIEYGCGDGNQLALSKYPSYVGFDVSSVAVEKCEKFFSDDNKKTFKLIDEYTNEKAELTLSLDVIYHLVEDDVYFEYMDRLFDSSVRWVVIYSSNLDEQERLQSVHVKHRKFSSWVKRNKPEWRLVERIANRYPHTIDDRNGSFADFYIYELCSRKS